MNWKEALQRASNDSSIAYRIKESCDHIAAIWPKDGIVFVGEENPSIVCHVCTKVQSEEQVERLLEEVARRPRPLAHHSSPGSNDAGTWFGIRVLGMKRGGPCTGSTLRM